MGERCEMCHFWQLGSYSDGKIGDRYFGVGGPHTDGSVSNCRRRAPTLENNIGASGFMIKDGVTTETQESRNDTRIYGRTEWPQTRREDWCGEFKWRKREP